MTKPKVGLLPLYIELYDKAVPEVREQMQAFYDLIAGELEKRDLDVVRTPICRLSSEFREAVARLERERVECMVTLHLAYSPSLESSEVLAGTTLPIIVLDTTPSYTFTPKQDPGDLMYNHGIHGVQDMCNLLIRNGKPFEIEAGHWERSDVLDRVALKARLWALVSRMHNARVGRIGEPFAGMGDFAVPAETLKSTIGIETVPCDAALIRSLLPAADDPEVDAEMAADQAAFASACDLNLDALRETARVSIAVRRWIKKEKLSAFTMNFLAVDKSSGLPSVPFLAASKAMADGLGYAGEGDVLTAALVGALASVYPETTFTEMFCPDWENDTIFVSHMGEMNLSLTDDKPVLVEKPFPWTDAENPIVAVGRFKGGMGVYVNLAPGPNDTYSLLLAQVLVEDVKGEDTFTDSVRGWFKPLMCIPDFLEAYSRAGGTHHSALVYGWMLDELKEFGRMMGWNVVEVGAGES